MTIREKAAYLKGLTEGMGLDADSREGKLWTALSELLCDVAKELDEHDEALTNFGDTMDDVYEQLIFLQELAVPEEEFDDEDDEDEDEDEEDDDLLYHPSFRVFGEDEEVEEEEPEEDEILDDDSVLYDVTCPGCGETITFDEQTLDEGSIKCPNCGETLEFDLDGDGE